MVNSKAKSHIRSLFFLFLYGVLFFTGLANVLLFHGKEEIAGALGNLLSKPVTLKNVFYLPPNFVILNDINVCGDNKPQDQLIRIPSLLSTFSLPQLFFHKKISVLSFRVQKPLIYLDEPAKSLKEFGEIIYSLSKLPKGNFSLSLRKIKLINKKPYKTLKEGNLDVKISGERISVFGNLGESKFSSKISLNRDFLFIENFKLKDKNTSCQFQLKLNRGIAQLEGFILINNLPLSQNEKLDLLISDIDSLAKIELPYIEIQRLNFTLNNNPVQASGKINIGKPFQCDINLASKFRSLDTKEKSALKKISLGANLSSKENSQLSLNARLDLEILERDSGSLPLEKLELNVKDVLLNFSQPSVFLLRSKEIDLFSKTNTNIYNLEFKNFRARIYGLNGPAKLINFSSYLYDGFLLGSANLKMRRLLPEIEVKAVLKNAPAERLEPIFIHFSKVHGLLSSSIYLANYPRLIFKGRLHIKNGYLENFEFLKWIANLFEMPSLRRIDFETSEANFVADERGAGLYDMNLDSAPLKINGYFKLNENDLVSSKIFLTFGKLMLQKSIKFKPLLKLIDKNQSWIKFNFQLSGKLNALNFKWLESDFKEELTRAIPSFAKKSFEEKVSKTIETILVQ